MHFGWQATWLSDCATLCQKAIAHEKINYFRLTLCLKLHAIILNVLPEDFAHRIWLKIYPSSPPKK
jgi:hypothetical protein